jgi:hypothetical protein
MCWLVNHVLVGKFCSWNPQAEHLRHYKSFAGGETTKPRSPAGAFCPTQPDKNHSTGLLDKWVCG